MIVKFKAIVISCNRDPRKENNYFFQFEFVDIFWKEKFQAVLLYTAFIMQM